MTKINEVDEILSSLGVLTKNSDGSLRGVYEVVNDISCAFSKLDTTQQLLLSRKLAGSSMPIDK